MTQPQSRAESAGSWLAVQTKRAQELRVSANLSSVGIENFLPLVRTNRRPTAPDRGIRCEPLFATYLFAKCAEASTAHRVKYTRGVVRLVGTSAGPVCLDDDVIVAIRNRMDESGFVAMVASLRPGDPVRVCRGPLRDFLGVFESHSNPTHRVRLLLNTVSAQVRLVIDTDAVVAE